MCVHHTPPHHASDLFLSAHLVHGLEVVGQEVHDEVRVNPLPNADAHGLLEHPRRRQRRLVGVHKAKRLLVEQITLQRLTRRGGNRWSVGGDGQQAQNSAQPNSGGDNAEVHLRI